MKHVNSLFVFGSLLVLSHALFASNNNPKLAYDASVLSPGSRIVAGDLSKNEFFILANNNEVKQDKNRSTPAIKPTIATSTKIKEPLKQKPTTKVIKIALKSALNSAKNKPVTLSEKKSAKVVAKHFSAKTKVASSKKTNIQIGKQHATKMKSVSSTKTNKPKIHALTIKKLAVKKKMMSKHEAKQFHRTLKS